MSCNLWNIELKREERNTTLQFNYTSIIFFLRKTKKPKMRAMSPSGLIYDHAINRNYKSEHESKIQQKIFVLISFVLCVGKHTMSSFKCSTDFLKRE